MREIRYRDINQGRVTLVQVKARERKNLNQGTSKNQERIHEPLERNVCDRLKQVRGYPLRCLQRIMAPFPAEEMIVQIHNKLNLGHVEIDMPMRIGNLK